MNRPGFSILHCDPETRTVQLVRKSVVDNKNYKGGKKPHGQRLAENAQELRSYMDSDMELVFVRERGFHKHAAETEVIFKMVGVADLYAWHYQKVFEEIPPTVIKQVLTGNQKATKEEVAEALEHYVGKQDYTYYYVTAVYGSASSTSGRTAYAAHRTVKRWNGSAWEECIVYCYQNGTWVECIPYVYNGSGWSLLSH